MLPAAGASARLLFAHHLDDAVETYLMGLLYSGQLGTFMPKTYLDRTGVTGNTAFCLYPGAGYSGGCAQAEVRAYAFCLSFGWLYPPDQG